MTLTSFQTSVLKTRHQITTVTVDESVVRYFSNVIVS